MLVIMVDEPDNDTASVYLSFNDTETKYLVNNSVTNTAGKTIVAPQKMYFKKVEGVVIEIKKLK